MPVKEKCIFVYLVLSIHVANKKYIYMKQTNVWRFWVAAAGFCVCMHVCVCVVAAFLFVCACFF